MALFVCDARAGKGLPGGIADFCSLYVVVYAS